jgi:hypothetical protein
MKKSLLFALCAIIVLFATCKKPVDPPVIDYSLNYLGSYLGNFTLTVTSMNNQPQSAMSFSIDSIGMDITKGAETNAIMVSMTIENEPYHITGTASADKVTFTPVHLTLDKSDFSIVCDIHLEGEPIENGIFNFKGDFSGNGSANIMGQVQTFDEVSGTVEGKLQKLLQ